MTYWAIERQEGTRDVFLPNEALSNASHCDGINTVTVRGMFGEYAAPDRIMQIVAKGGRSVVTERQELTDLLYWSWVPIFSERARNLAVELGCESDEFWQCAFESNPGEAFFMHVPERSYDVVDVAQSTFLMVIPGNPPIPHHILSLVLRNMPTKFPPCFRALVPGHRQVFGELIVNDTFKKAWKQKSFTGARFRRLTE